jgi:hypothetical protein
MAAGIEEGSGAANLLARKAVRRGRATLGAQSFYLVCGGPHNDGWWPSGRHHLTSGPNISLSATDRWAALNSFSKLNFNNEIELSTRK